MTHKAIFFNLKRVGDDGEKYLEASEKLKAAGVEVAFVDEGINNSMVPTDTNFDILAVFMDSAVDAATIAALPNLKLITTLSTGYDHIDLAAAATRGIPSRPFLGTARTPSPSSRLRSSLHSRGKYFQRATAFVSSTSLRTTD